MAICLLELILPRLKFIYGLQKGSVIKMGILDNKTDWLELMKIILKQERMVQNPRSVRRTNGLIGLMELIELIGLKGLIGLIGLIELIGLNGLVDLNGLNGLLMSSTSLSSS